MSQNFELIYEDNSSLIDSIVNKYRHVTGAELIFIKNKDKNKVFSVAFKTLPENDYGIAHILEHCVLCGSRRFDLKDTFNELASCSLFSYLNAMTFKDKTVYPIASIYEQEFKKLTEVYLDAVYNPNLRLETFLHEAWHYEINSNNTRVNGVVYSEMKSAFSNPIREIRSSLNKKLFPDSIYQYESSGVPEEVLKSSHNDLINFHKKYYCASNSFIYLYGDINDIEYYLKCFDFYLNSHNFNRKKIEIKTQKPLEEPVVFTRTYDFAGARKNFYGAGYVTGNILDLELLTSVAILNSYLSRTANAPLKKFLPSVKIYFESEILQPIYFILSENFNGSTEKFKNMLDKIFESIASQDLNKILIESCINNFEFDLRIMESQNRPKGLVINLLILDDWIHGGNILSRLDRIKILDNLREKLNSNYFNNIIKKCFVDNNHAAFICLMPNNRKVFDVNPERKDIDNYRLMKDFINTPEKNTKNIKLANIEKIDDKNNFLYIKDRSKNDIKIFHLDIDSNDIIYINIGFKTDSVPENLLGYLEILKETLVFLSLEKIHGENVLTIMNNIGNIKIDFDTFSKDNKNFTPMLIIRIKTLSKNINDIFNILDKILNSSNIGSRDIIKKVLIQKLFLMSNFFISKPVAIARQNAVAYFSQECKYRELVNGTNFYLSLKKIFSSFDETYDNIVENINIILNLIIDRNNAISHITCDNNIFNKIHDKIYELISKLDAKDYEKKLKLKLNNIASNQAFFTTSSINTNSLALQSNNDRASGKHLVLESFLNKNYLIQEIRVNGGAYDSACKFKNNILFFYSYADPNIKETFEKFKLSLNYVAEKNFSEKDLKKAIIGTINALDKPKTIENQAYISFSQCVSETTKENIELTRKEVISSNLQEIKEISFEIFKNSNEAKYCTIGSREKILENSKLFSQITKI
ncbi:MAG: insulinase family protein [Clostridiales bacterium]|jgi:Zn-dependent M16 (insulinase) family peptidase|nr:insulinase family protein [Clostridiales bacterium]